MKYEKRHHAYKPTLGGSSVPSDSLINDLGKRAIDYIGTFSEYNPIGYSNRMAVIVRKNNCTHYPQRDFKLKGFQLKSGMGYHSEKFNNNYGIKFSKEDLLRIAHTMDETDELHVMIPDSIDEDLFQKQVKIVTGL